MGEVPVSVIIPTFNRPAGTVKSVKSALKQNYEDYEVIVVDDGSTDDTWGNVTSIEDSRVKPIKHSENQGGNAARNTGINHANGKYIAFLDSDDIWHPDKLKRQIKYIESTPNDAVYCDTEVTFDSEVRRFKNDLGKRLRGFLGRTEKKPSGGSELIPLVLGMEFPLGGSSTLVVDKKFLIEIGCWDEQLQRHQDWELLVRILKNGRIGYIDEKLVSKHDTGSPGYSTYFQEKKKFLGKHAEKVVSAELNGTSIIDEHHFGLAKRALREGKYRLAFNHITYSNIRCPIRILTLLQPLVHGRMSG